jgi:hypothetical protein
MSSGRFREISALTMPWNIGLERRRIAYAPSTEKVRDFWRKQRWCDGIGRAHITALYNNGSNLYAEPFDRPATVRYKTPWFHVRFVEFCAGAILCTMHNRLFVQTHGHSVNGTAIVTLGWKNKEFSIPPRCILYVATENGILEESFLQYQPLPNKLCPRFARF